MCWLSAGGEFHAQPESIKMSGCKNPCKALAKIEYENRHRKNSRLSKFRGNTSLSFKEWGSSLIGWDHLMLGYCYQKRAVIFLTHSRRCGHGAFLCGAPWTGCDVQRLLLQLEAPFGSPCAGQGAGLAGTAGSRTGQGRAALIDSFCHGESHLWLSSPLLLHPAGHSFSKYTLHSSSNFAHFKTVLLVCPTKAALQGIKFSWSLPRGFFFRACKF